MRAMLNVSAIYEAIFSFFLVNLPVLWYLSKSFFKGSFIQPPGEPREQHFGEVQHLNCY